jgi:hypothetical protein
LVVPLSFNDDINFESRRIEPSQRDRPDAENLFWTRRPLVQYPGVEERKNQKPARSKAPHRFMSTDEWGEIICRIDNRNAQPQT